MYWAHWGGVGALYAYAPQPHKCLPFHDLSHFLCVCGRATLMHHMHCKNFWKLTRMASFIPWAYDSPSPPFSRSRLLVLSILRLSHATIAFHLICIDENAIRSLRFKHEYVETPSLPAPPPPPLPRDTNTHSLSLLRFWFVCIYTYIIRCLSIVYINISPPHHSPTSIDDKCSCRRRRRMRSISFTLVFFWVSFELRSSMSGWLLCFIFLVCMHVYIVVSTIPYWDRSRKIRINKLCLNFSWFHCTSTVSYAICYLYVAFHASKYTRRLHIARSIVSAPTFNFGRMSIVIVAGSTRTMTCCVPCYTVHVAAVAVVVVVVF